MGSGELILIFAALMVVLAVLGIAVDWIGKPLRNRRFIPRIYRFEDEHLVEADPGRTAFSEDAFLVPSPAPQGVPYVDATGVSEWAQSHFVLPDPEPAARTWGALTSENPTEEGIGFAGLLEVNTYDTMEQSALLGETMPMPDPSTAEDANTTAPQAVIGVPAITLPPPPTEDFDLLPPPPPESFNTEDLPPPPPDDDELVTVADDGSFFGGHDLDDDDDVFFAAEETAAAHQDAAPADATTEPNPESAAADAEPEPEVGDTQPEPAVDDELWPKGVFDPTAETPVVAAPTAPGLTVPIVPGPAADPIDVELVEAPSGESPPVEVPASDPAAVDPAAVDRDPELIPTSAFANATIPDGPIEVELVEPVEVPAAEAPLVEVPAAEIPVVEAPSFEPPAVEPDPDLVPQGAFAEAAGADHAPIDVEIIEPEPLGPPVAEPDPVGQEPAFAGSTSDVIEAELVSEAPAGAVAAGTFASLIDTTPTSDTAEIGGRGPLLTPEQATSEPGVWMPGDPLWTPTAKGTKPSPTLVRRRFWQSASVLIPGIRWYGVENIERMADGQPPRRRNRATGKIESMQITGLRSSDDRTISRPYWPSTEPDPFEEY